MGGPPPGHPFRCGVFHASSPEETRTPALRGIPGQRHGDSARAALAESGGGIDMATTQHVKWTFPVGSYAYGNPTIARGRLIVGTDDEKLGTKMYHALWSPP